ncbi:MAG: hypothetical protein DWQ31_04365 [Planctomycetota bacterium]|nr:MAG: hypothetical protein DWQ31_04365 [Planctomycetota bacterium]REJ89944.1 MAG: hypothetical protein DWQ35_17125 [Planctomycetota bacterium]REK28176.1 MAG: hypothetical protein DWQ42_05505 [Planctomycetota bacterium]REK42434.1 MAG: hypothetical protein DWQ46_13145 [Planctomycetota bacterium]
MDREGDSGDANREETGGEEAIGREGRRAPTPIGGKRGDLRLIVARAVLASQGALCFADALSEDFAI